MHRIDGWNVLLAVLLCSSACSNTPDEPSPDHTAHDHSQACAGAACVDAAAMPAVPDAGTHRDAAVAPPSGHTPDDTSGCVPSGPSVAELGAARRVVYPGSTDIEPMRSLWQVSARSQGVFVADEQRGIFRVNARDQFERVVSAQTRAFLDADLGMYFVQGGKIMRVSLSGTDAMPSEIASGVTAMVAYLAYDQDNLYFVDQAASTLVKLSLSSGAQVVLQSAVHAADMKLHAGFLYYSDTTTHEVYRLAVAGGTPKALTTGDSTLVLAIAIAPDSNTLYFVDGTQIVSTPLDAEPERKELGQAGPATSGRGWIKSMTLQGERLYWSDDVGNVGWTATDGSECGLLVRGTSVPNGWDVDERSLYLTMPDSQHGSALWQIGIAL